MRENTDSGGEDDGCGDDCRERENEPGFAPEAEQFDDESCGDADEERSKRKLINFSTQKRRVSRQTMKTNCARNSENNPHCTGGDSHPLSAARSVVDGVDEGMREQNGEGRENGQNVFGEFGLRKTEKDKWENGPASDEEARRRAPGMIAETAESVAAYAEEERRPWQKSNHDDRREKPEGLAMLKNRSEVALEIVFDEENMEEAGIFARAEHIPGKSDDSERENGEGMKHAKSAAEILGRNRP